MKSDSQAIHFERDLVLYCLKQAALRWLYCTCTHFKAWLLSVATAGKVGLQIKQHFQPRPPFSLLIII